MQKPRFIDGIVTKDIMAIHVEIDGKRIVQVHKRDAKFTNLATVDRLNLHRADALSMDMIYNIKDKTYDLYVVLKTIDKVNVIVEMVFDDIEYETPPEPWVMVEKERFSKHTDNCGDTLKVS